MRRWILGIALSGSLTLLMLISLILAKVGGAPALLHLGALVFLMLVVTLGLAAFNTLCGALFARPAQNCRERLQKHPLRCYLMGLLTLLLEVFLLIQFPPLGLMLLLVNVAWFSFSLPALAGLAGEGMGVNGRWAVAAGSLPLGLTMALPILGWLCTSQLLLAALGSASLPRVWRR